MRRFFALVLLLAVSMVTSSPAWALALADHSCCATTMSAEAANPSANVTASTSKHAHCAAMAHTAASTLPQPGAKITSLHSCCSCAMGALLSPRNAAGLAVQAQDVLIARHEVHVQEPSSRAVSTVIIRDERGPPSLLV